MSLDIGDYITEAIIDTGSEFTSIKQGTAELMRMEVNATKHVPPLQGVTGKKLRVLGPVIANVRIGDQVLKSNMVVVSDHYLHLPALLGMDIIGRLTDGRPQRAESSIEQYCLPPQVGRTPSR